MKKGCEGVYKLFAFQSDGAIEVAITHKKSYLKEVMEAENKF